MKIRLRLTLTILLSMIVLSCAFIASKAETVSPILKCVNNTCLSAFSDIAISNDGSFILVVDSASSPYIRKINFIDNKFNEDKIISLKNPTNIKTISYMIAISQNNKRAVVFGTPEIVNTSSGGIMSLRDFPQNTFYNQFLSSSGDCKCSAGAFFDEMTCISGTLNCTNSVSDPVCSCDNLNYLNSCIARANGVRRFSKGGCGTDIALSCSNDSQCPLGSCSNGTSFKRFACNLGMCALLQFNVDPCPVSASSSSSSSSGDCRCPLGSIFNETTCIGGALDCTNTVNDPVCSCDNLNYLNSCIARANGVRRFSKGACGSDGGTSCSTDSQCPIGTCTKGGTFKRFTCTNNKCTQIQFSSEPCLSPTSSETASSIVHVLDLTNDSIKTFTPSLLEKSGSSTVTTPQLIRTLTFLDPEGNLLIASSDDSKTPKLLIINSDTGETERDLALAGIAKSIEISPSFNKAIFTFKDTLAQSIGIFNTKTKELIKLDTPSSIFFDIDEFLSMVSFDRLGNKAVISSLDVRHVLHLVDLEKNKFTIKFLSAETRGQTQSTISLDGNTAIAVGNDLDTNGGVVYKLNTTNPKFPRLLKKVNLSDIGLVTDVLITSDNNELYILVIKNNENKLEIVDLKDLSLICELSISSTANNNFLIDDPLGKYVIVPDFKDNSISSITDLKLGPIFQSITPTSGPKAGGTSFTITGFLDPTLFEDTIKVCFKNNNFCTSAMITNNGSTIIGKTPKVPFMSSSDLILIAKPKAKISASSSQNQCKKDINPISKFDNVFKFE